MYKVDITGPSTEPWGSLQDNGRQSTRIVWCLRYPEYILHGGTEALRTLHLWSVRSRPDFFMTGAINASLKPTGKWPESSERLNGWSTNGAIRSAIRFKTYVIGSAAEHLSISGSWRMAVAMSLADTGVSERNEAPVRARTKMRCGCVSGCMNFGDLVREKLTELITVNRWARPTLQVNGTHAHTFIWELQLSSSTSS